MGTTGAVRRESWDRTQSRAKVLTGPSRRPGSSACAYRGVASSGPDFRGPLGAGLRRRACGAPWCRDVKRQPRGPPAAESGSQRDRYCTRTC